LNPERLSNDLIAESMRRTIDQVRTEWLVLRSQAGDSEGFEELISQWHRRVLGHVNRLTRGHDESSDIMQDIWMTVARKLRRLNDPACFPQWIYRIATAHCADWVRRRTRERELRNAVSEDETISHPPRIAEAERTDDKEALQSAVRQLPSDQRTVLTMFYLDELSTGEIATALAIPIGTVKSRLYHARNHLRQQMEEREK
jgi:RNA polymerase sigma-70 factor (ECF subfamily)